MVKSEKELLSLYKKYIHRPVYRVVPSWSIKNIIKNGINPEKNPYEKIKSKLFMLFQLVKNLESKGIVISFQRGPRIITGGFTADEIYNDLNKKYIDFCISDEQIRYYLSVIKGGAIPAAIKRLTDNMLSEDISFSKKELKLVKELNKWSNSLISENKIIFVNGSSKVFENALFKLSGRSKNKIRKKFSQGKYLESPFGSFEHFKKIIEKYGFRKYSYSLRKNKFYLRVKDRISKGEIKLLK